MRDANKMFKVRLTGDSTGCDAPVLLTAGKIPIVNILLPKDDEIISVATKLKTDIARHFAAVLNAQTVRIVFDVSQKQ